MSWLLGLLVAALYILAPVGASAQEYLLGAGDKLRVTVLADTDFSGEYEVDGTGAINARNLGRVVVNGMSVPDVERELTERYRQSGYLKKPRLTVELIALRPFFILGEVNKPGSYPYVTGLTVARAVAIAGGYARRASTSRIKIERFGNPQHPEEATEGSVVQPGDIIRVPERLF